MIMNVCDGNGRSNGIIEDHRDSLSSHSHPLFGKDSSAIQFLLYYDKVELCNALGSSRKKTKYVYSKWYMYV